MIRTLTALVLLLIAAPFAGAEGIGPDFDPADRPSLVSGLRFPSELSFCGEPVPLEVQEVRERLEKEMLLTLADRPQVILWLKRSDRYLPLIESALGESNLPNDLKYIAVIESALRPHVGSPAGAIGFWQFMQATGRNYGLRIDSEYDERRSIFKSTRAAAAYFKALYDDFQSWTLAAAAYNMGEEGLKSEILLQKVNDYYRLYLPLETQRYVFRILSAKLVLENPQKYGFHIDPDKRYPALEFDRKTIVCSEKTPLHVVASAAGTYFKQIKDLNPDIRGHYLEAGEHTILIPKGSSDQFDIRFEVALERWLKDPEKQFYDVKPGDSLYSIAQQFEIPLPALLVWNDLDPRQNIHPGDRLILYSPKQLPETEQKNE